MRKPPTSAALLLLTTAALLALVPSTLLAQPATQPAFPKIDLEAIRRHYYARFQKTLAASDEEWTVIQPRLEKVETLKTAVRGFNTAKIRKPDEPPAPKPEPVDAGYNDMGKAMLELRQLLSDKDAAPDEIKKKLADMQKARAKVKADLTQAQQELREVVNLRQEGQLLILGILE